MGIEEEEEEAEEEEEREEEEEAGTSRVLSFGFHSSSNDAKFSNSTSTQEKRRAEQNSTEQSGAERAERKHMDGNRYVYVHVLTCFNMMA